MACIELVTFAKTRKPAPAFGFGLFEISEDEYRRWREAVDTEESQRIDRVSAFVENDHVSGVYEVIDVLEG